MKRKRDFISIKDFSRGEIEILFVIADKMKQFLRRSHGLLAGYVMGSLFLEPSTRTRLSFEAAMNRLGGRVITMTDARSSSIAKGESLADSVRTVGCYADIIVLRHPNEGAALLAAEYSPVPVINAGDGGHEHPTQTLCDLYTLRHNKGRIAGLNVILYGDLKYGRTTHSLALALSRFGADVLCIAETALGLPLFVARECAATEGVEALDLGIDNEGGIAIFGPGVTGGTLFTHDRSRWPLRDGKLAAAELHCDAIYVTRLQRERLQGESDAAVLAPVDEAFLERKAFTDSVVLHPLPRVDEIDYAVDDDPRGIYFEQAALGVPIRMALISYLLGREYIEAEPAAPIAELERPVGARCPNANCIVNVETSYLRPRFHESDPGIVQCRYCDAVVPPGP